MVATEERTRATVSRELRVIDVKGHAVLPKDATDTGYEYDSWHLWLTGDRDAAYIVDVDDPSQVERWPAANDTIACA